MKKSRRKFSSAFKATVAIEALKKRETLEELSKRFELHPTMISKWKQEFLERSAEVFESKSEAESGVDPEKLYYSSQWPVLFTERRKGREPGDYAHY